MDQALLREVENKNQTKNSWKTVAKTLSDELGETITEQSCKKRYQRYLKKIDCDSSDVVDQQKLLWTIRDERNQVNEIVRKLSREETLKDIAKEVVEQLGNKCKLDPIQLEINSEAKSKAEKEAILQISDWHYGVNINSALNSYSTDICKERVQKLLREVATRCVLENVTKLTVVNLGDMIAGRIHYRITVNSRIDVITQVIEVTELISQFLYNLSKFVKIDYYDTLDNHGRIEPDKNKALELESLVRITTWVLKERLYGIVNFYDNEFADDIATFKILNQKIIGVHGHKDPVVTLTQKLQMVTRTSYDLVLVAHNHSFGADESNETIVVRNGSLMGTDDHAMDHRWSSNPSQNLIFVTEENPIDSIQRILL